MRITYLPVFLLPLLSPPMASQDNTGVSTREISNYADEKYGPYADLVCGEKYRYPYWFASGDPFYGTAVPQEASVRVKGKRYDGQKIRFDIYNQLVVLESGDRNGASRSIILREEWLDKFSLGEIVFKKIPDENGSERFGQVIFEGEITCIYFWSKRYLLDSKVGGSGYFFSDPIRHSVLHSDRMSYAFTGRKSFLNCFPQEERLPIKAYLRENRVSVRKAGDHEMHDLMEFINQLKDFLL